MEGVERPFGRIIVPKNINLGNLRASLPGDIAAQTAAVILGIFIMRTPEVDTLREMLG
jgi:hypothetical protein